MCAFQPRCEYQPQQQEHVLGGGQSFEQKHWEKQEKRDGEGAGDCSVAMTTTRLGKLNQAGSSTGGGMGSVKKSMVMQSEKMERISTKKWSVENSLSAKLMAAGDISFRAFFVSVFDMSVCLE